MEPLMSATPMKDEYTTKTIDNFLSDEELDIFWSYMNHPKMHHIVDDCMRPHWPDIDHECTAYYNIFKNFHTEPEFQELRDILLPKIQEHFGDTIKLPHIHILQSRFPYGIHNDANQEGTKEAPHAAWTLIIPFKTVNSKTYVFNERSNFKDPDSWITQTNAPKHDQPAVDRETFLKDFEPFTGEWVMDYLSVESIFEWKRGTCFAADRYKYHCSDNYYNYGLTGKDAIIIWTTE